MTAHDLPAGRALDAEIAEKVMGLSIVGTACCIYVEGGRSIRVDSEPDHWACDAEMGPVFVEQCICDAGPLSLPVREDRAGDAIVAKRYNERHAAEFASDRARFGHSRECLGVVPHYSTDIAAAWEMEAAIPAGRRTAYLNALKEMVGRRDDLVLHYSLWALIRATPEQRCRAALAAMEHAPLAAVERAP